MSISSDFLYLLVIKWFVYHCQGVCDALRWTNKQVLMMRRCSTVLYTCAQGGLAFVASHFWQHWFYHPYHYVNILLYAEIVVFAVNPPCSVCCVSWFVDIIGCMPRVRNSTTEFLLSCQWTSTKFWNSFTVTRSRNMKLSSPWIFRQTQNNVQCHNCMLTLSGSWIWSKIKDCHRNCTAIRCTAEVLGQPNRKYLYLPQYDGYFRLSLVLTDTLFGSCHCRKYQICP